MSKSRVRVRVIKPDPPSLTVLKELVLPAFEQEALASRSTPSYQLITPEGDDESAPSVQGCLRDMHLVNVEAFEIDCTHTSLRFSMMGGYLTGDYPSDVMLIGNLLDPSPFHIRSDTELGLHGRLMIGCDLMVRSDDAPLVRRRLGELLQLAGDLEWFFPLRLPSRLHWREVAEMEIGWDELPHQDLSGFLDEGLAAPRAERTPQTLLRLAQGFGRWQDVLRLLREHRDVFDPQAYAPVKCLACRQQRRWLPAIRAAREGGIRNGRFPGAPWVSPSYLHALIEGGDEIEALRILGKPAKGEPGFYGWLRGFALHHAGDFPQASEAFNTYFKRYPGDVLGAYAVASLQPDTE
jgi:hypothetical protein